jgi:anti-sigma factor RsiW
MKCEEFESIILDVDRAERVTALEKSAAEAHLDACARCAALQESWQATRGELAFYAKETQLLQAPLRVEMRLRQEFRMKHRMAVPRRAAAVLVWALAAAAVLFAVVSLRNWPGHPERISPQEVVRQATPSPNMDGSSDSTENTASAVSSEEHTGSAGNNDTSTLVAANDWNGFTLLPGALPSETGEASILRVGMQRGALSAFGLPVNEERAGEWIQVDLLVGDDGIPQAVRLPD